MIRPARPKGYARAGTRSSLLCRLSAQVKHCGISQAIRMKLYARKNASYMVVPFALRLNGVSAAHAGGETAARHVGRTAAEERYSVPGVGAESLAAVGRRLTDVPHGSLVAPHDPNDGSDGERDADACDDREINPHGWTS